MIFLCSLQCLCLGHIHVYMPYFDNGRSHGEQTEVFVDTIDSVQSILDNFGALGPVKIAGDFNVQLPRSSKLHPKWHRDNGFNIHSKIMHDFLVANNLVISDFAHKQEVEYTYFNIANSHYT